MASKMEQIIDEIEEYIDGCKTYPLSSAKIIVNKDEIEETLIMSDIDVNSVELDEDEIIVNVAPSALNAAKEVLASTGVNEFLTCEIQMVPNDYVELSGEDETKFKAILEALEECEDVQAVWHNAKFND